MKTTNMQWAAIAGLLALYVVYSSFYTIDTSDEGVVTRFGAFHKIAGPGPHLKIPGIDDYIPIPVTRIHEEAFGFRKDKGKGQIRISKQTARLESLMLTGDLNVASVLWVLQYKISDPKKFVFNAFNVRKNIRDTSISVMRRVVGDKLVSDVLTKDRVDIARRAKKLTQEALDSFDMGIQITKLNLQSVTPPEKVRPAFNEINIAKQEKEQAINQANGVYNKVIPEAEGKAAQKISEAQGYAVRLKNQALGDSNKFAEVLTAYKASPVVTRKRLYLETMEDIFSRVDKFTIVDSKIKGLIPIFGKTDDLNPVTKQTNKTAKK